MGSTINSDFSANQIAGMEFPTVFRGYDQEAVKMYLKDLADTFDQVRGRGSSIDPDLIRQFKDLKKENQQLKNQISYLNDQPGYASDPSSQIVDLRDDQVAQALGQEATKILEAARTASAEILDNAHLEAEQILEISNQDAIKIKEQAERSLDSKRNEVDNYAHQTLASAEKLADSIKAQAREEYARIKKEINEILVEARDVFHQQDRITQQRGNKLISDAESYREKILGDLIERKRVIYSEIESILTTKETLAETIKNAREILDTFSLNIDNEINLDEINNFNHEEEIESAVTYLNSQLPDQQIDSNISELSSRLEKIETEKPYFFTDSEPPIPSEPSDYADSYIETENNNFVYSPEVDQADSFKIDAGKASSYKQVDVIEDEELEELDWGQDSRDIEVTYSDTDPVLVAEPFDSNRKWDEVVTTVSGRAYGTKPDMTRGDLPRKDIHDVDLPALFKDRDVALKKIGTELKRVVKRALNDDQSNILNRLKSGTGELKVGELESLEEQLGHYYGPLRRVINLIAEAGVNSAGASLVSEEVVDSITSQLARHIVTSVRIPTVDIVEKFDGSDRESVLDPIRNIYREFRNDHLDSLLEDAKYESYAIGYYSAIPDGYKVVWLTDPRLEPDPLCEINARTSGLEVGEIFPSGHTRPLSLPGCRCLLVVDALA